MTQNIRNWYILVHKLDVNITWLNLYGMIFHEQHSCGYGFPSQPLATCASAGVSELFLSKSGEAAHGKSHTRENAQFQNKKSRISLELNLKSTQHLGT